MRKWTFEKLPWWLLSSDISISDFEIMPIPMLLCATNLSSIL